MHLRKITTVVLSSVIALSITTTNVFADITGNITASTLNVRSGPSTSYKRVDSISKNSSVTILQESNGWYKVKLSNGNTGWVSSKYVRKDISVQRSQVARDLKVISQKKVTANILNIRKGPSITQDKIGTLKKGNIVDVLGNNGEWIYISFSGKTGYVSSKYLVDISNQASDTLQPKNSITTTDVFEDTIGKVTASKLNVRSGPGTGYKSIGSLSKNNSVNIVQESNGWYKVKLNNGNEGWVSGKYVSKNLDVQQSAPSRGSRIIDQRKDSSTNNINYVKVSISLNSYISSEVKRTKKSAEALRPYIDPIKYTINNKETFMQFLKLNKFRQINVNELNNYLNNLKVKSGKTNIFYEQGQAFVNTAKKHNIDPVYLVAHTLVETGFGMSDLAQGYEVVLGEDGQAIRNTNKAKHVKLKDSSTPTDTNIVKVYNLFGIGAVDSAVISGGTTTAYDNNWTSIPNAIEGSAKWIRDNYIYRGGHAQDTLYKMRYNYVDKWHQYATDIGWATKISKHVNNLSYLYTVTDLDFEVPVYK